MSNKRVHTIHREEVQVEISKSRSMNIFQAEAGAFDATDGGMTTTGTLQ